MGHDDSSLWIVMIPRDDLWWPVMMIHDESWWLIMMLYHDDSSSWIIMMHHYDPSWWIMMNHDDSTWWIMMTHHYEAPCGPEKIPFRAVMCFLQWEPWHVSKASFCHGRLVAMAPMAFVHAETPLPFVTIPICDHCHLYGAHGAHGNWDDVAAKWQHKKQLSDHPHWSPLPFPMLCFLTPRSRAFAHVSRLRCPVMEALLVDLILTVFVVVVVFASFA